MDEEEGGGWLKQQEGIRRKKRVKLMVEEVDGEDGAQEEQGGDGADEGKEWREKEAGGGGGAGGEGEEWEARCTNGVGEMRSMGGEEGGMGAWLRERRREGGREDNCNGEVQWVESQVGTRCLMHAVHNALGRADVQGLELVDFVREGRAAGEGHAGGNWGDGTLRRVFEGCHRFRQRGLPGWVMTGLEEFLAMADGQMRGFVMHVNVGCEHWDAIRRRSDGSWCYVESLDGGWWVPIGEAVVARILRERRMEGHWVSLVEDRCGDLIAKYKGVMREKRAKAVRRVGSEGNAVVVVELDSEGEREGVDGVDGGGGKVGAGETHKADGGGRGGGKRLVGASGMVGGVVEDDSEKEFGCLTRGLTATDTEGTATTVRRTADRQQSVTEQTGTGPASQTTAAARTGVCGARAHRVASGSGLVHTAQDGVGLELDAARNVRTTGRTARLDGIARVDIGKEGQKGIDAPGMDRGTRAAATAARLDTHTREERHIREQGRVASDSGLLRGDTDGAGMERGRNGNTRDMHDTRVWSSQRVDIGRDGQTGIVAPRDVGITHGVAQVAQLGNQLHGLADTGRDDVARALTLRRCVREDRAASGSGLQRGGEDGRGAEWAGPQEDNVTEWNARTSDGVRAFLGMDGQQGCSSTPLAPSADRAVAARFDPSLGGAQLRLASAERRKGSGGSAGQKWTAQTREQEALRQKGMKRRLEQSVAEHDAELEEAQEEAKEKRRRRKLKRRFKDGGVIRLREVEAKVRRERAARGKAEAAGEEIETLRLVQAAGTQECDGVKEKKKRKLMTVVMEECNGERKCG